ncbi:ABC transporter ATP-binding protein [Helicobacter sp. 10-6591]|uniref:ABC transporter ATP-binding protein n=1 Tax=Helicobacter sp. 10-6591 TaxID=2004998 RepID=UPI000DCD34E7|nr:ABC transporter ATP-binding protein [Helicobacter sp. 10-6591]RAX53931.1 ABC transporter ATP-binding protein [Helicobacter sp. 10-6591]
MLLHAQSLTHCFENTLYKDLELTLESKQSIAIMGVSGSGKSTLLHNLSTMLKPTSGQVMLFGLDIYSLKPHILLTLRREKIGIIFQAHYLFRGFSVKENLEIASILSGNGIDMELLEKFGIAHTLHQDIGSLSGGQQQRLSIVRILTKKPKIIFADEPTGNLDSQSAYDVMECLLGFIRDSDSGLLIVTHDINVAKMCDRAYKLEHGVLEKL